MNVFLGFAIVVGRTVDDGGWSEYMENMPAFHSDGDVVSCVCEEICYPSYRGCTSTNVALENQNTAEKTP